MPYDLNAFTAQCHDIFKRDPGPKGREEVRVLFEKLLRDPEFVRRYCVEAKPGLHVLYEDPELKFQVLAHVNEKPRVSPPHDHGESWAIYGQATEYTDVTEWTRTDDGADPQRAELKAAKTYRLTPGRAAIYQDGCIHSIDYPAKSCFVRVTGTNLDRIARVMFDLKTGAVTQMTPQRAT
jgi:predicted metal-dependent enzyme (double-stranded beta helix superfamily)